MTTPTTQNWTYCDAPIFCEECGVVIELHSGYTIPQAGICDACLIAVTAAVIGCHAVIATGDELQSDNERIIAAINETAADDRPAVDESPWTVGECASLAYGDMDLGTRVIVSGGEVVEIDTHLESQYDERTEADDLPF